MKNINIHLKYMETNLKNVYRVRQKKNIPTQIKTGKIKQKYLKTDHCYKKQSGRQYETYSDNYSSINDRSLLPKKNRGAVLTAL